MKRIQKYRNLLWVLVMVASGGNFLHAQGMEEKAIDEASYSFNKETNKFLFKSPFVSMQDLKKSP